MHWTDIEARLQDRIEEVCRHLFPNGKRVAGEFVVGSLAGEAGESLKINLTGKLGVWKDFAGDRGGKSLMSLWLQVRNLPKFGAAVVEAKRWLGLEDDFPQRRVQRAPAPNSHTFDRPDAPAGQPDASSWSAVADTWAKCQPPTEGGPVWNYLTEERKLDPTVLEIYQVREYLSHGKWAMVFPYFAPADTDAVIVRTGPAPPEWLKFEALDRYPGADGKLKKKEWTSKAPEKSLFGIQLDAHPAFRACRHVLICEGEKDALSWAAYGCAGWGILPVSVPFGAKWKGQDKHRPSPNREWLDRAWDWLELFETVFVAMDADEAGQRAAADIINEIGPRRCRLVTLPAN